LRFINEDAASIHGGIKVASLYTGESGEWKLGGFEVLSSLKDDDAVLYVRSNCFAPLMYRHMRQLFQTPVVTLPLKYSSQDGTA
jgi:hypothetical protein